MYKIIGGDGNEYGPVSADILRQWFKDGRVNGETRVKRDGGDWATLFAFPDFADLTRPTAEPIPKLQMADAPEPLVAPVAEGPFEGDYQLEIGGCIMRGWRLYKSNFGVLFGGFIVYLLIEGFMGGVGSIPIIGAVASIVNFIIAGPLAGGLFYLFLKAARDESPSVGDIFSGFSRAFGQLFLGQFVVGALIVLCLIPALVAVLVMLLPFASQLAQHHVPANIMTPLLIVGAVTFLCLIPATYLQVSWKFTLLLIVDRQVDFVTAMKTSWRRVNLHWWSVFGLVVLSGLILMIPLGVGIGTIIFGAATFAASKNPAALVFCFLGGGWSLLCVLVIPPIMMGALVSAYETIFSGVSGQDT